MKFDAKFNLGDRVYLITDIEQKERFVVGICIKPCGFTYHLSSGDLDSWHYDFEISSEKDVLKSI